MRMLRIKRAEGLYLVVCLIVGVVASVTAGENYAAFYLLMFLLLPLSMFTYIISYLGGLLVLGLGNPWLASVFVGMVWIATAIAQVIIIRMIFDARAARSLPA